MITTTTDVMPTLNINSQGDAVLLLQKILIYFGYLTCDRVTGYYGSKTSIAVRNFQIDRGLESNGVVNQQTWQSLIDNLPVPS
jgi:peptidoglycan hydrolase-like protein with peptidoglycan-binding domain